MWAWAAAAAALLCSLLPAGAAAHGASAGGPAPAPSGAASCESARLKCAFRTGCGHALQNYMVSCSSALQQAAAGHAACPEHCQHALIALTSTDEGKDLMTCKCGDDYCEETKQRVEVCRPHVEAATLNSTVVSCRLAQWICKADALCSTALDYYHRFCRSMFQGKRCSRRCNNSISILQRQEKAAKLISCRCDGADGADCAQIRENMDRLCFPNEAGGFGEAAGPGTGAGAGAGNGAGRSHPQHPEHRPAADAPGAAARAAPSLVLRAAAALATLLAARRLPLTT